MHAGNVSVVIPAFNHWELTRDCVERLRAVTPAQLLADIVVVDDGSTDERSVAWASALTAAQPVLLPQNRGFSHACNAGARAGNGELLLFLNNDAFVTSDSIAALRAAFDDPAVGVAGAKLLYADGTLQHAGLALLDGPVSRWWHVHRHRPAMLPDANVARDMLAVTGAALMIRRELFAELGGFDTGYVNGWEDVDLCLRAWSSGARVRYEPRSAIEHLESATLGNVHDNSANERRFADRWTAPLAAAARYPLPDVPPIALAIGTPATATDRWAAELTARCWTRSFGARVTRIRQGSRLDRARVDIAATLAKRWPVLEIAWERATLAPPTGAKRIGVVAPLDVAEAQPYARAHGVGAWWTPTAASRAALVAAGIAADRIEVVALGAERVELHPRGGPPVVAAQAADAALLAAISAAVPGAVTRVVPAADPAPALDDADLFLAPRGGDRWGLLIAAALARGCSVLASAPLDPLLATSVGVEVVADDALAAAACARLIAAADLRIAAPTIHASAGRRLDARLATQHASEAARAFVHATPSTAGVVVDARLADSLRRAAAGTGLPTA